MPPRNAAKLHDDKHHQAKDLRRAYEHMGRVAILQQSIEPSLAAEVNILAALARQALESGHKREAAELLRAAEHLSFAALADESGKVSRLAKDTEAAVMEEFEHMVRNAEEHWKQEEDYPQALTAIWKNSLRSASEALERGKYHRALEFARAAEALAHGKLHGSPRLGSGKERLKLSISNF